MLKSCSKLSFPCRRQTYAKDDMDSVRKESMRSSLPEASQYHHWPEVLRTAFPDKQIPFRLKHDSSMNPSEVRLRETSLLSDERKQEHLSESLYAYENSIQENSIREEQKQLAKRYSDHHLKVRWLMPSSVPSLLNVFATDTGKYVLIHGEKRYIPATFPKGFFSFSFDQPIGPLSQAISQGIKPITLSRDLPIVGGDIIPVKDIMTSNGTTVLFVGHGVATDDSIPETLRREGLPVIPIKTLNRDPFFHLDTFFCPLPSGYALFYPGTADDPTTDEKSKSLLRNLYPGDRLIEISESEARAYATNCVVFQDEKLKKWIIIAPAKAMASGTRERLEKLNFAIEEVDYLKVQELKGSIRCTTLEAPEMQRPQIEAPEGSKILGRFLTDSRRKRTALNSYYRKEWRMPFDYIGEIQNFLPQGYGKIIYTHKQTYEGELRDGLPHGKGKLFNADGKLIIEGEFRDGINGKGKLFDACGELIAEGEFRNGIFPDGRLMDTKD